MGKSRLLREFERRASQAPRRHAAHGPLPALRLGHRLLGAGRGGARRGGDRGLRQLRRGLGQALPLRAASVLGETEEAPERHAVADRPLAGPRGAGRSTPRRRRATPSGCATRSSPRCASVIEASAARRPLVLAFEDIHWADDGMLDAIEHLAQWVRAPLLLLCLARDELLERRGGWGGGRRNATQLFLDPLTADDSRRAGGRLLGDDDPGGDARARRWPSAPAATRCSPRRWCAASPRRRATAVGGAARHGAGGAGRAPRRARARSSAGWCSRPRVVGRTFWEGSLAPAGRGGGPRPRRGAAGAAGARTSSRRAPSRAWRASASWRSSTC